MRTSRRRAYKAQLAPPGAEDRVARRFQETSVTSSGAVEAEKAWKSESNAEKKAALEIIAVEKKIAAD
eukprot:COSAG06_NODE_28386_length_574_cov_1.098739_1_plen_67_part_10